MTQCIALSFFIGSHSRECLVEGLLNELMKNGEDIAGRLVFLPGNFPKGQQKRQVSDHEWANGIAKKYGIYLFAEKGDYRNALLSKGFFLFSPDARPVNVTGEQLVFDSDCARENYGELANRINDGSRSITVAGRKITIAICGENGIVTAKKENPQWRFPECTLKKPGGILFNPIHTQLGRGFLYERRFKFLTKAGGYQHAIALANSYQGTASGKAWPKNGGLALFNNGKQIVPPIPTEFGEHCGIPQNFAFTFTL